MDQFQSTKKINICNHTDNTSNPQKKSQSMNKINK